MGGLPLMTLGLENAEVVARVQELLGGPADISIDCTGVEDPVRVAVSVCTSLSSAWVNVLNVIFYSLVLVNGPVVCVPIFHMFFASCDIFGGHRPTGTGDSLLGNGSVCVC